MKSIVALLCLCCVTAAHGDAPTAAVKSRPAQSASPVLAKPSLRLVDAHKRVPKDLVLAAKSAAPAEPKKPSFLWALLANWMSYLSLGLTIPVLARVISTIVNPDGSDAVSPKSSVVGGDVEALDKILTFLFCGGLGALSDKVGRKPLMAYSALGFAMTCFLQARATNGLALLYVADFVDGISSCMNNVCQGTSDTRPCTHPRSILAASPRTMHIARARLVGKRRAP